MTRAHVLFGVRKPAQCYSSTKGAIQSIALALLEAKGCFGNLNQFLEGIIHCAVGPEPWLGQPLVLGLSEVTSSAHEWCSSAGGGVGHLLPPSPASSPGCVPGALPVQGVLLVLGGCAPRAGAASGELSWRRVLLPAWAGWKSA